MIAPDRVCYSVSLATILLFSEVTRRQLPQINDGKLQASNYDMFVLAVSGAIGIECISLILQVVDITKYCHLYRKRLCGKGEPDLREVIPPWLLQRNGDGPLTYTQ